MLSRGKEIKDRKRWQTMALKILVTGAAGFIGSHTCQKLLARGHRVVGLDNLCDYYSPDRKRANLAEIGLAETDRFRFQAGDIRDRSLLGELLGAEKFDAVVHLAAMVGVRSSIEAPALHLKVNVNGTLNLLLGCVEHDIGNFVLASTSSAYGNTETIPFVENDPCDRPLAPYAASKRAAEMLAYSYHHLLGLNVTVLRFFTVYGPRGRPDMMAHKIFDNMVLGTPLQLFNNGEMWRDWTYVDDIVEGVANATERPLGYEVINLARGEMVKLTEFLAIAERSTGRRVAAEPAPKVDADVDRTFADISKARRLLDYQPKVSVREGVEAMWRWYESAVASAQES